MKSSIRQAVRAGCMAFVLILATVAAAPAADMVTAADDAMLAAAEQSDRVFTRMEIGDKIVYFHERVIDRAIVEDNYIIYHFDKQTGRLLGKKMKWHEDLEPKIAPVPLTQLRAAGITKEQAEAMVEGEVQFSELVIIAADSDIYPIDPVPENPCWVVRSIDDGAPVVSIIDSVTGKFLGYGIPPPQITGFSISGPMYWNPCRVAWFGWYQNAAYWFDKMGYETETVEFPAEDDVRRHIQSFTTAVFYELAHGGDYGYCSGCIDGSNCEMTTAHEIEAWIADYPKIPFTFLGSCGGMCNTADNTLSFEFRKGSTQDTATVGYCGMAEPYCSQCWGQSINWQEVLFSYLNDGKSVKEAYDQAMIQVPHCFKPDGHGSCMRWAGDSEFKLVPVVSRSGGDFVEIVNVSSGESYTLSLAEKGGKAYIDRGYTITGITSGLNGGVLVQTANDDKSLAAEDHLTLRFSKPAMVYVCYDRRASTLPPWLQGWRPTAESISTTDSPASPMKVYWKSVTAGEEISLGGNHAGGDTGARSNYLVVVQPFPVEIVSVSSAEPYALSRAEKGVKAYIDRGYAITGLTPELNGGVLVQTANDDKSLAAEDHITLRLLKAATVYVCYDKRVGTLPVWLQRWTPAGESISTTDISASPMKVYRKSVAADDEITLGGNHAGGDTGAKSNYLVVVQPFPVEILNVSTGEPYALTTAEKGAKPYIDRNYAITAIAPELSGGVLVQTANDDKSVTAEDHLALHFSKPATVYVCCDKRGTTLPPWLRSWTPAGESISTTDTSASPMKVYRKRVAADDEIILGGNHAGGDTGAKSNYLVVVAKP